MRFRVQIQKVAAEDLIGIWETIAVQNPPAADKLLRKLDQRIDSLFDMPERGVPRDDLSPGVRILIEGKYLIFYRVQNSKVVVLRVIHGAKDLSKQFV
jgi:toxin ParE1/3/4